MAITYIDKHNDRDDYPDVVAQISRVVHAEEPAANVAVYVVPKFNPMEPLEWSAEITSPRGRRHITITQRKPRGAILFSPG